MMQTNGINLQETVSAVLLVGFTLERISNTFNKKTKRHQPLRFDVLFTSLMLFLYACVVIVASFYYFYHRPIVSAYSFFGGAILLVLGITFRRLSISQMNDDWCVYISAKNIQRLVTNGVFTHCRHPYYLASLIELSGISLLLGCNRLFIVIFFVYAPLVLLRSIMEEKQLIIKFKNEYLDYKRKTSFFRNSISKKPSSDV